MKIIINIKTIIIMIMYIYIYRNFASTHMPNTVNIVRQLEQGGYHCVIIP